MAVKNKASTRYSRYAKYYPKIFSSLPKEKGELLCTLVIPEKWANSIDNFGENIPNALGIERSKKKHLRGLLIGVSLDYMEATCSKFFLEKLRERKNFSGFDAYLILAQPGTLGDSLKISENWAKKADAESLLGFVSHNLEGDYVLLGKRKPAKEIEKIESSIGLD